MPKGKKESTGLTVNKTVSMPIPVVMKLADFMEVNNLDFSTALVRVLKLGFSVLEDMKHEVGEKKQ